MTPVDRWNDQAIDQLAETLRAIGPSVGQVISTQAELKGVIRTLQEYREGMAILERRVENQLQAVASSCAKTAEGMTSTVERIEKSLDAREERRELSKTQKTVAMIAAGAVVFGSLITSIAALLQS